MTEQEWLDCADPVACPDPQKMLEFLQGKASHRKLRLFACACCRRIWAWLDDLNKRAVEAAEQFADGLVSEQACIDCRDAAYDPYAETEQGGQPVSSSAVQWAAGPREHFIDRAGHVARCCQLVLSYSGAEPDIQASLLHDIFGNPFRPISIPPAVLAWNDGTLPRLAQAIYEERAFNRLPILADALEDAGCNDADILRHCRGGGEHVRGCWVVDLVLGKE
jgi:hypothetical protein